MAALEWPSACELPPPERASEPAECANWRPFDLASGRLDEAGSSGSSTVASSAGGQAAFRAKTDGRHVRTEAESCVRLASERAICCLYGARNRATNRSLRTKVDNFRSVLACFLSAALVIHWLWLACLFLRKFNGKFNFSLRQICERPPDESVAASLVCVCVRPLA